MAAGWMHATMDLIAFGRSYFDLHQYKDHPWKELSYKHRQLYHEWYNEYGKNWDFDNPFPPIIHTRTTLIANQDEAEKFQSCVTHDYLDKIWDTLNPEQRHERELAFKWLLENPDKLNEKAGINVFDGLIYRVVDGKEITELCPELIQEYKRLRQYVTQITL